LYLPSLRVLLSSQLLGALRNTNLRFDTAPVETGLAASQKKRREKSAGRKIMINKTVVMAISW